MKDHELLQYAIEHGMINMSYVQEQINMSKRKELLEKHPYKIWEGEKDGRWYTYIPDRKKGRVLRSRSSKKQIEDCVCDYWEEELKNPTIKEVYDKWIKDKLERKEITISTKNRYDRQYNESMKEFGENRIKNIEEYDIERFILDSIHKHNMTAKGYSNLRTLIFGIFKRAKKEKLISFSISSVVSDIEISKKIFRKVHKKDDELIFMEYEIPVIISYFKTHDLDVKDFGIWFLFYTGLRPGELAALKWEDVDGNIIHIKRTEIRYEDELKNNFYEVRDFPKTDAGIRDVVIPPDAENILRQVKEINPDSEFVFESNGKRIPTYLFDDRIRIICKKTGLVEKSLNKIRKTYGTILLNGDVDESLIISQMGHTDIKTTKKYYYKNRKSQNQKIKAINKVFNEKVFDD